MNKYSSYTNAELEEHLSNYLIDSWSYSKVASFSRNEKEFEKREIYRERSRSSSSTVAGNAPIIRPWSISSWSYSARGR